MSTRKRVLQFIGLAFAVLLVIGCGSTAATPATLSTPAPVSATAAPSGHITGGVHLMAPPTPRMVVYALDTATGVWVSAETEASDGVGIFDLAVAPGSYQVFAADAGGTSVGLGYSTDSLTLTLVTIAAGQTVSDISVGPPSQSECGSMMGYPASPDGRFAALPGPSAECLAAILTPAAGTASYVPVTEDVCLIIQELAAEAIALSFSMELSAPFADPLTGETGQGCTLTAMATGMQFADPGSVKSNLVNGMQGWTEQTAYQADGPTGSATAMTRDMGLMLINVVWMPSPEVQCPADQPISACELKPEQKLYTIQIQTAMK